MRKIKHSGDGHQSTGWQLLLGSYQCYGSCIGCQSVLFKIARTLVVGHSAEAAALTLLKSLLKHICLATQALYK